MTYTRFSQIARLSVLALIFTTLMMSAAQAATTIVQSGRTLRVTSPMTVGPRDILVVLGRLENFSTVSVQGTMYIGGNFINNFRATLKNTGRIYGSSGRQTPMVGQLNNRGTFINQGWVERFETNNFLNSGTIDQDEGYISVQGLTNLSGGLIKIQEDSLLITKELIRNQHGRMIIDGVLYVHNMENGYQGIAVIRGIGFIYPLWSAGPATIYNNGRLYDCSSGYFWPTIVGNGEERDPTSCRLFSRY